MNVINGKESEEFWKHISSKNMLPNKMKNNKIDEFSQWYQRIINRIVDMGNNWETNFGIKHCCQPGCNACCVHPIEVYKIEVLIIIDYLKKNKLEYLLDNVNSIVEEIISKLPNSPLDTNNKENIRKYKMDYIHLSIPCVFLKDGKCAIYPVRPINCAIYYSYGSPEKCMKDGEISELNYLLPLEPWSFKQMYNFTLLNRNKFKDISSLFKIGTLPMMIKECMQENSNNI